MKYIKGYTLPELLMAVAVVGVLVTLATPFYQGYRARASVDNCLKSITPARMVADNLIQSAGGSADNTVIANAAALGLTSGAVASADCDSVSIANQTATGNIDIIGVARGNTMRWRRSGANGSWVCTSSDASLGTEICP